MSFMSFRFIELSSSEWINSLSVSIVGRHVVVTTHIKSIIIIAEFCGWLWVLIPHQSNFAHNEKCKFYVSNGIKAIVSAWTEFWNRKKKNTILINTFANFWSMPSQVKWQMCKNMLHCCWLACRWNGNDEWCECAWLLTKPFFHHDFPHLFLYK